MVKRVAVMNDLSGLGKCSLTAAIPVLSVMGVQACPLPTAVLTNQTGYESFYCDDYTDKIDLYTREWIKRGVSFDGIYTGFLGSMDQVDKILTFCETFRKKDTLLVVDPVMGDCGMAFPLYTPAFGEQMKRLVTEADVVTPNLTEFCILTGADYGDLVSHQKETSYLEQIYEKSRILLSEGIGTVIITGIIYQSERDAAPKYYNLIATKQGWDTVSSNIHGGSYSGTGDLLASVVCADMVNGHSATEAVSRAAKFLEAALIETVKEEIPPNDGINFEPYLSLLLEPTCSI